VREPNNREVAALPRYTIELEVVKIGILKNRVERQ